MLAKDNLRLDPIGTPKQDTQPAKSMTITDPLKLTCNAERECTSSYWEQAPYRRHYMGASKGSHVSS